MLIAAVIAFLFLFRKREAYQATDQLKLAEEIYLYELANPVNYKLESTWGNPTEDESYLDAYTIQGLGSGSGAIGNMQKYLQKWIIDREHPRNYIAKTDYDFSGNPGVVDDLRDIQALFLNEPF